MKIRYIQKKGLEPFLNKNPSFQYLMNLLYSLAMVPVVKVAEIYDTVIMDFLVAHEEDASFLEFQDEINDFLAYYDKTWMGVMAGRQHNRRTPLFAIPSWNKNEALLAGHQLTNNTCEGANHAWNASVGPHPSLFVVLEQFITEDSWAEKILREDSLAVGRNDQANHSRTLEKSYQLQDTQCIVKDYANLEPKSFMDMLVNTFTR
jgi:hypothetical protein